MTGSLVHPIKSWWKASILVVWDRYRSRPTTARFLRHQKYPITSTRPSSRQYHAPRTSLRSRRRPTTHLYPLSTRVFARPTAEKGFAVCSLTPQGLNHSAKWAFNLALPFTCRRHEVIYATCCCEEILRLCSGSLILSQCDGSYFALYTPPVQ